MSAIEHNRRQFLSIVASAIAPIALGGTRSGLRFLSREKVLRIGVFGPRGSDRSAPFTGHALARGLDLGVDEAKHTAQMFGFALRVDMLDENDLADSLRHRTSANEAPYVALLGGSEPEYCLRIAAAASASGALYFNAGCTADSLRGDRCGRHVFHIASSDAMRFDAALATLTADRAEPGERWLLLAGSKKCEDLMKRIVRYAGKVNATVECLAIPPVFGDTVLIDAVKRTQADVLIFPPDAGVPWTPLTRGLDPAVTIVDTAAERSDSPTSTPRIGTTLSATDWHGSLERFGAGQLSDRFRARYSGTEMHSFSWSAWLAVKVIVEAAMRSRATTADGLIAYLEKDSTRFDGHKGVPLSFRRWDHQLRQPVYVVRSDGAGRNTDRVSIDEQPVRRSTSDDDMNAVLDQLGFSSAQTSCRWDR